MSTPVRLFQVSSTRLNEVVNPKVEKDANIVEENSHPVAKRLMDFFDVPENWGKDAVKSGKLKVIHLFVGLNVFTF